MKYKNTYKCKWFILGDEIDEDWGFQGTIDDGEISNALLLEHAKACLHHGIPMYVGEDEKLHDRCCTAMEIAKLIDKFLYEDNKEKNKNA